MSVAVFDNAELEALWGALDPADTDVARAIYVLGCANRAAYMTSYSGETVAAPTIEAPRLDAVPKCARSVSSWFENLLYNCVSNGGSNFAAALNDETLAKLATLAHAADRKHKAATS